MIPVALFVRVSKASQDYNRQISDLQKVAADKGWRVVATFAEKVSGASEAGKRKAVTEMLEKAKTGAFRKVLVTEVSRLGRRTVDVLTYMERLKKMGISMYVDNLGIETLREDGREDGAGTLIFTLMAELAREERARIIERVKSGLDQARLRGATLGRPKGDIETAADTVKKYPKVVRLLKEGLSLRKTAMFAEVAKATVQRVQKALDSLEGEKPESTDNG